MQLTDHLALIVSVVALALSFLAYRFERLSRSRPVLVFSMTNQWEWTLSNVGDGPATHVLLGDGYADGRFDVVRCYPMAVGAELKLTWLRGGHTLAVVYSDALDRTFTTTCTENRNTIARGDRYPHWPEPKHQWRESLFGEGRGEVTITERIWKGSQRLTWTCCATESTCGTRMYSAARDLDAYFRRQPWYRPREGDNEPTEWRLSAAERYVAHMILDYQRRHGLKPEGEIPELFDPAFSLEPDDTRSGVTPVAVTIGDPA